MKTPLSILIFFFLCTAGIPLLGQKVTTNDQGEKIVVFDDGTWRPYVAKDSILQKKSTSEDFFISDDSDISVFELPPDAPTPAGAKPAKKKKTAEQKAMEEELAILENKLYKFSLDPSIPESDLALIRSEIQSIKERMAKPGPVKVNEVKSPPVTPAPDLSTTASSATREDRKEAISFNPPRDFIYNPPGFSCDYALNTIDGFDKRRRVDMNKEILFTYTDPKLKPHLKGNEFLTCQIYLNEVSPYKFINLHFVFSTLTAKREYGALQEGTSISFLLVNGQTVTLKNTLNDPGAINTKKSITEYKALLPVSSAAEKAFSRSPIDKIRIVWSSGFEDYEVFNVDVLMNQLNCLNSFN